MDTQNGKHSSAHRFSNAMCAALLRSISELRCAKLGFLAIVFCGLVCATRSMAQGSDGTIAGTVKDPSGAVITGATISVRNMDTNVTRTTLTESSGYFSVPALTAGNYEVKVEHAGFQPVAQRGIVLTVSQEAVVNFSLPIGTTDQVVEVNTSGPLVNTTDNTIGGLVGEHAIADLPLNGRNYVDLAEMEPGTSHDYAAASGGFSNHGSTPWSNMYTLDGALLNNALALNSASLTGNTLGLDGIEEFKIVGIPDASYGLVMGGQIVMVSKGGTNQFHGNVFEYIRNSVFDARNYFDYLYQSLPQYRISHFSRNQFGASLGGPIRKNKTFFFGTYEGLLSSQAGNQSGQPIIDTVPALGCLGVANQVVWNGQGTQPAGSIGPCTQLGANPAGPGTNSVTISPVTAPLLAIFPQTGPNLPNNSYTYSTNTKTTENFGQIRVDHTLSAKDSLFGRYTVDNGVLDTPTSYPQFRFVTPGVSQFLTLGETHVFSPTLLNVFRLSGSRITEFFYPTYPLGPLNDSQHSFVAGQPIGLVGNFAGITGFGEQASAPRLDNLTVYTLSDDVSATRGKHSLKFGTLLNLFRQAAGTNGNARGTINFNSLAGFLQGNISGASVLAAPAGFVPAVSVPNINRYFGYSTYGFYVQDAWRATPRLTLNGGLRYEFMDTVNELNGNGYAIRNLATDTAATPGPIMLNPTLKNFNPRVGFALDVFGDGKTSLRGGIGIYRDVGNLGGELREYIQGTPPYGSTSVGAQKLTSLPLSFSAGVVGRTVSTVDYHDRAPYEIEYNLTAERQLLGMGISATYVGLRGLHLWTRVDGNPVIPAGYEPNGRPYYSSATAQPACVLNAAPFCRTNPYFSVATFNTTVGNSSYNSLELNIVRPVGHGVEFQTSYTWSKSIDDTESMGGFQANSSGCETNSDPLDRRSDRGPSCFDTPNKWNVNMVYHLPGYGRDAFASTVTKGWYVSNIVTIQSGTPYTPIYQQNRSNSGVFIQNGYDDHVNVNTVASIAANPCTSQPGQPSSGINPCPYYVPIPYDKNTVATHNPAQWFNPAMFSLGQVGHLGTAGRDMLRSPYLLVWNASAVKDTPVHFLGEKGSVQFRAELFNPLNKSNFGIPSGVLFAGSQTDIVSATGAGAYLENPISTAGKITSTLTSSRQLQLALKLIF